MSDESNRVREAARALIEEYRREQDGWLMREATVGFYDWATRQNVPLTRQSYFLYRAKDNREEAPKNTSTHAPSLTKARVRRVCDRLNGLDDETVKWLRE